MPKRPFSIEFLDLEAHFSAKMQVQISNLVLHGMLSTLGELFFGQVLILFPVSESWYS